MRKEKEKIKEEIMKIISVPPKKEGDTGYLKLTEKEIDKIVELFRKTIKRFIEETNGEKVNDELYITKWGRGFGAGWNGAIMYLKQKQLKWLKENL